MDLLLKSSLSSADYCRTCMTRNSSFINIFECSINSISIDDILKSCTSINVNKNDIFPKSICQLCYDKLYSFYEFRISAEEIDTKFKELYEENANLESVCTMNDNKHMEEINIDDELLCGNQTICYKEESEVADSISDTENQVFVFLDNTNTKAESIGSNLYTAQEPLSNFKTNNNRTIYTCEICNKRFRNHYTYQRHIKTHLNNNDPILDDMLCEKDNINKCMKCDVCASVFKSSRSLSSHMRIHRDGKKLTCKVNHGKLNEDLLGTLNTTGDFQCEVCKGLFRTKHSLSAHMRKHAQKGRVLACSICGKIFTKISHLKRHEFSHADKCPYKCGMCKKSYPTEEGLQEHRKQHNDIKPHVCPVCQKAFYNVPALNTHIKIHTRDKLYLCPTCGKRFDSSTNLNQHVRRHIGIKAFVCSLCPKKFVSKGELKSHSITHTGERSYKCEQCTASFTKHSSLAQHTLRHLGVKPHHCDTCPMKFTSKSHLKRHYRIHTGEKPYRCDMCERAFTQSNDLVKHRRGHLGDKIYKCNECTESFRLKSELCQHVSQHYVSQIRERGGVDMASKGGDIIILTELTEHLNTKKEE